ncbi:D-alanine--D-alanine ligase family protein [uncultured Propionibacterium sp.]|uniref:D-alanine--D-alanine ligase family protein n=1 Tax=uncultured Propionibacterium sp. TaxID=218066 RepID=UPI0029315557|nr:D-alanine--D-alanine ligase family protein [uncultured Propionibacterium sp.]
MSADERIKIAVVFGGQSNEHEVSCLTAAGVLGALDPSRYEVHGVGIDKQGVWRRYSVDEIGALRIENGRLPSIDEGHPLAVMVREPGGVRLATLEGDRMSDPVRVDVAFPVMHGAYCEDGCIQGHFETLGLRYVGCGVTSSANGMDKAFMRICFEQAGIPLVPWLTIAPAQWREDRQGCLDRVNAELRYPVYVKPARGGSSVGISRVGDPARLAGAVEAARAVDPKVVVEQGVVGAREIECGVLAAVGEAPRASRPGEIIMHANDGFYDYSAKYLPEEQVELQVPADLPADVTERVRATAIACFEALDCEGLSRVDFFVLPDGRALVNEINTMPGFTPFSMYPSMWRATDVEYADLIGALVDQALARPASVLR